MTEVQLNFLNLNTFFLIGLIILTGGYLYYEIHKMKQILNDYDYQIYQIKSLLDKSTENNTTEKIIDEEILKDDTVCEEIVNDNTICEEILKDDTVCEEILKDDTVDDVWNEINDLMEENPDNNLDILNVSENGSSHIEDLLDEDHVPDYNNMTVSQLKNILIDMKLPVSGNKTKLIERINNNK